MGPWTATVMLLWLGADDPARGVNELTTVRLMPVGEGAVMSWSDTEDVLRGSLSRQLPVAGEPITVSVRIVDRAGTPFAGPVTLSVRPLEGYGDAQSTTVMPSQGAHVATFTPRSPGVHRVEAAWRSGRYKVVRGQLDVSAPAMSEALKWTLAGALTLLVTAFAAWLVRRSA